VIYLAQKNLYILLNALNLRCKIRYNRSAANKTLQYGVQMYGVKICAENLEDDNLLNYSLVIFDASSKI
jgi:hypothetical protein